jgi:hypothetical protein
MDQIKALLYSITFLQATKCLTSGNPWWSAAVGIAFGSLLPIP